MSSQTLRPLACFQKSVSNSFTKDVPPILSRGRRLRAADETHPCRRLVPMRFYIDNWNLMLGVMALAVGILYMASPRFVEWVLNNDRRGRMWIALLGRTRATVAMRYIFSLILIVIGAFLIYVWLDIN